VLNVSQEAEPVVIEAAYRALMKKYHPDQAAGAPMSRSAAEINGAYFILRDPARRAEHDHKEWSRQQSMLISNVPAIIPRRRSRTSRFAGWALAIAAGCGIGLSLAGSISIATPGQRNASRAATNAVPKPALDPELRSPEEEVAEFLSTHVRPQPAEPAVQAVSAELPAAVGDLPEQAAAVPRPSPPRVRARVRERSPDAAPRKAEEQDFLEREDYIY
jgi:curved DNA-binding protein CbpA